MLETGAALGEAHEDMPCRVPDTAKVNRMLGWKCATSLHEGLTPTIAWARRSSWWLGRTLA